MFSSRLTFDTLTRADLVLPLGRHHLGVDTRDLDSSVQACLVMSLHNVSAEDLASTDSAIVRALGSWKSSLRPAIWPAIGTKDCVFLFQTKPRLMLGIGLHQAFTLMSVVELVGGSIRIPGLGHDQDVVASSERIGEDGDRANVDIGIVAWRLAGG